MKTMTFFLVLALVFMAAAIVNLYNGKDCVVWGIACVACLSVYIGTKMDYEAKRKTRIG